MSTNPILGRDVYIALAAVGWADGQLTPEAADAIVRTALEEGLAIEDVAAIEAATRSAVEMGAIDRMNMSKADRLYVYAIASWIAQLDGPRSARSQGALAKLGDELGIPEPPRRLADRIMQDIAAQAERPERFDFIALRRTLDEQHQVAQRQRIARKLQDD
jgi:hypothetical protein